MLIVGALGVALLYVLKKTSSGIGDAVNNAASSVADEFYSLIGPSDGWGTQTPPFSSASSVAAPIAGPAAPTRYAGQIQVMTADGTTNQSVSLGDAEDLLDMGYTWGVNPALPDLVDRIEPPS